MKKSEMVDKMIGHFRGAQNLGSNKAIFNYILDKMLEVGMLPPHKYIGTEQDDLMGCMCMRGDSCLVCNPPGCYDWEPEDD